MSKIIDYKIVKSVDLKVVESMVKQDIANGWQPYGDLVSGGYHSHYEKYQPMVLYENNDIPIFSDNLAREVGYHA